MREEPTQVEARRSWVSRDTWKRLPLIFLPMLAFLVTGPIIVFSRDRVRDRYLVEQSGRDIAQLHVQVIEREFEAMMATLLHFADQGILRDFLEDRSKRNEIEREYVRFCKVSGVFDQLRLIGEDGQEALRINDNGGNPRAVPAEHLQSKTGRYYFLRAQPLERNQIYVSPIDLNLEHGGIEEPWKPVLRMATPVFDESGSKGGILVFNYLGGSLFEQLEGVAGQAPGWTGLVNRNGFYLEGPDEERSWGFMFEREPTFAADHPDAWEAIKDQPEGSFSTEQGMFAFRTINPIGQLLLAAEDFPTGMKVVSFVPTSAIYAASRHTFESLAVGTLVLALLMFGVAWRLAVAGTVREVHEQKIAASEKRLRRLSRRLLDAQEAERRSLARDLHDEVGQLATAMTINLKRAHKAHDLEAKDVLIERSVEGTSRLLDSMHRISSRIRSSVLDDLGLEAALRSCGEDFEHASEVTLAVELDFEEALIPDRVAENVYRIVQEALTNVSRHAQAQGAALRVLQQDEYIMISVQDHGLGFDPSKSEPDRIGLLGMRERAELLGGSFTINSSPDLGTVVEAAIPMNPPEPDDE